MHVSLIRSSPPDGCTYDISTPIISPTARLPHSPPVLDCSSDAGPRRSAGAGEALPHLRAAGGAVGGAPEPGGARVQDGGGGGPHLLRDPAGGDGRLHRAERRRQVHHHQDAHRHPGADRGAGAVERLRAVPRALPLHQDHRRGVRAAHPVVVGHRGGGVLPAAEENLRGFRRGLRGAHARVQRRAGDRALSAHAGAQAEPGRAHALRHGRGAAAQSPAAVPGRAHHRARHRRQGEHPGVPEAREPASTAPRCC